MRSFFFEGISIDFISIEMAADEPISKYLSDICLAIASSTALL